MDYSIWYIEFDKPLKWAYTFASISWKHGLYIAVFFKKKKKDKKKKLSCKTN